MEKEKGTHISLQINGNTQNIIYVDANKSFQFKFHQSNSSSSEKKMTEYCKFAEKGKCQYGRYCKFKHYDDQLFRKKDFEKIKFNFDKWLLTTKDFREEWCVSSKLKNFLAKNGQEKVQLYYEISKFTGKLDFKKEESDEDFRDIDDNIKKYVQHTCHKILGHVNEDVLREKAKSLKGESHAKNVKVTGLSTLFEMIFHDIPYNRYSGSHTVGFLQFLKEELFLLRIIVLNDMLKKEGEDRNFKSLSEIVKYLDQKKQTDSIKALRRLFDNQIDSEELNGLPGLLLLLAFIKVNIPESFDNSFRSFIEYDCQGTFEIFRRDGNESFTISEIKLTVYKEQMKSLKVQVKERLSLLFVSYWLLKNMELKKFPHFFINVFTQKLNREDIEQVINEKTLFPFEFTFEFL